MCTKKTQNRSLSWIAVALVSVLISSFAASGQTSSNASIDLGPEVAAHPLFKSLSARVSAELGGAIETVAKLPASERQALIATMNRCRQGIENRRRCTAELERLGLTRQNARQNLVQAREIAAEVGLESAEPSVVAAAFRHAQLLADGTGAESALAHEIANRVEIDCDDLCLEHSGNVIGSLKGSYLVNAASGDGEGGGSESAYSSLFMSVFDFIVWLEDRAYNSDEEDKECVHDSDCPSGEYCHKGGDNDCRPKLALDKLCTRNGQCKSDCCKPHISSGFLPECRKATNCNG